MKSAGMPATIKLVEDAAVELPVFTFETSLGKHAVEDIPTDIVLIPMLYKMSVPASLKASKPDVADEIIQAIKGNGFEGKRGTSLPVETSLPDSQGFGKRVILLAGLGRPQCFDANVAESVFGSLIDEAIERGVTEVTIPFIANRMTKQCLNLKGTAHRLKKAVLSRFSRLDKPVALKTIKIYCSPQARSHIEKGLKAPIDDESIPDDCCTA